MYPNQGKKFEETQKLCKAGITSVDKAGSTKLEFLRKISKFQKKRD
jgi:hypothetical protein